MREMDNAKDLIFTALLYAAAITIGIVAAKLAHGFFTGNATAPPNS